MRSQGCPGCQNFWNFVLKTNLLVCSAKIQLKLSKLPKYGQKQRFFRSFFTFFAFFQFWLNISASNCQNLIWHEIFDLLTPLTPLGARPQCLKRKLIASDTVIQMLWPLHTVSKYAFPFHFISWPNNSLYKVPWETYSIKIFSKIHWFFQIQCFLPLEITI